MAYQSFCNFWHLFFLFSNNYCCGHQVKWHPECWSHAIIHIYRYKAGTKLYAPTIKLVAILNVMLIILRRSTIYSPIRLFCDTAQYMAPIFRTTTREIFWGLGKILYFGLGMGLIFGQCDTEEKACLLLGLPLDWERANDDKGCEFKPCGSWGFSSQS